MCVILLYVLLCVPYATQSVVHGTNYFYYCARDNCMPATVSDNYCNEIVVFSSQSVYYFWAILLSLLLIPIFSVAESIANDG